MAPLTRGDTRPPKTIASRTIYYAADCTACAWSFVRRGKQPTEADRTRARDHARRKRHKVSVLERVIVAPLEPSDP